MLGELRQPGEGICGLVDIVRRWVRFVAHDVGGGFAFVDLGFEFTRFGW
jgi:hypothetical protein